MFPKRVGNGKFLLRPSGREVRRVVFPNAAPPCGRLHWATIVAHSVRWPLPRPTLNNPLWEHSVTQKKKGAIESRPVKTDYSFKRQYLPVKTE